MEQVTECIFRLYEVCSILYSSKIIQLLQKWSIVLPLVYVDDLLITGNSEKEIKNFIVKIEKIFQARISENVGKIGIECFKDKKG